MSRNFNSNLRAASISALIGNPAQGMLQSKYHCLHSYSTNDVIDVNEERDCYTFKKFINAAIYVEKTIKKMTPDILNQKLQSDSVRIIKTKRCSCSIDAGSCPCHRSMASGDGAKCTRSDTKMIQQKEVLRQLEELQKVKLKEKPRRPPLVSKLTSSLKPKQDKPKVKKTLKLNVENCEGISPRVIPSENKLGKIKHDEYQKHFQQQIDERIEELEKKNNILDQQNYDNKETFADMIEIKTKDSDNNSSSNSTSSTTLSTCSQITVKRSAKTFKNEVKSSLSSLTSFTQSENESVREWLTRKEEERKKEQLKLQRKEKRKEIERQKILEKERENFKLWLISKKKQEEKRKAEMERQQQLDQLRDLEKEKRRLENEIDYQIWLQKKEEEETGKKNLEQLKALQEKIDHERRIIENERAFQEWVESSKNKPKPIPMNRGLDSLRSSMSVSYVNPVSWVPNIEQKPASQ